jgi:hypothetical protein
MNLHIHWNPFKAKQITRIKQKTDEEEERERDREVKDETETIIKVEDEPMSWKDAAKVSFILMLVDLFSDFFPSHPLPEPCTLQWVWILFVFIGKKFFVTFVALTGLALISRPYIDKVKRIKKLD